jgi:hypothetical protein
VKIECVEPLKSLLNDIVIASNELSSVLPGISEDFQIPRDTHWSGSTFQSNCFNLTPYSLVETSLEESSTKKLLATQLKLRMKLGVA